MSNISYLYNKIKTIENRVNKLEKINQRDTLTAYIIITFVLGLIVGYGL